MQSTTTVVPTEPELNGDIVLEDRAVGVQHSKQACPPDDERLARPVSPVSSADANATTSDEDDNTQSDADDGSQAGGSSDETEPEMEALEKELGRYVPRTKPSPPAVGAQVPKPPQGGKATSTVSRPPGTKNGRLPAVTAIGKTTSPPQKKK